MDIYKKAIILAEKWQYEIEQTTKPAERKEQHSYRVLSNDPKSKQVLITIFDQAFRTTKATKVIASFYHILKTSGIPGFFQGLDYLLVKIFLLVGHKFPFIALPLLKHKIRQKTAQVILPAEKLASYVEARRRQGLAVNLNHLGEAVLGETEAKRHLDDYLKLLEQPYVDYISIKLSNIFSELHPLA